MARDYLWALDCLYSLANWETRPPGTKPTFELDRIRRLLDRLGRPQAEWPAVHVGGTNGKGSVAAMVAAALQAAGYSVGLYTSPHLHTVRERIQVDRHPIGENELTDWLSRHRRHIEASAGLTTFEALTAMAFATFAERKVDIGVIEVGLGGRLDTTNVVQPIVSVLTSIALDHESVLGETVGQIARDKCGIIRAGVPVVSAPQVDDAWQAIAATSADMGAEVALVGREITWVEDGSGGQWAPLDIDVRLAGRLERYRVRPALQGPFQHVNAATAVGALAAVHASGRAVPPSAVAAGLAAVRWPARFERLGGGPIVVVDGAHNAHAAEALAEALATYYPGRTYYLIYGSSLDKRAEQVLELLLPSAETVLATAARHPRAMPAAQVAARVQRLGRAAEIAASPCEALATALDRTNTAGLIVATGSLFLAAEVRSAWCELNHLPAPPSDPPIPEAEVARPEG